MGGREAWRPVRRLAGGLGLQWWRWVFERPRMALVFLPAGGPGPPGPSPSCCFFLCRVSYVSC